MKRALICILAMTFVLPAAWADEKTWPDDMADVQALVRSSVGRISYDKVKVRRFSDSIEVEIRLKNMSREYRSIARAQTEDDVYLATSNIELFKPSLEFDIVNYDLLPIADIVDYYFGFAAFNFGKTIKLPATIKVISGSGEEFRNRKKKFKIRKNRLVLRFVERGVSGGGLHQLCIDLGPWQDISYFCVDCG